MKKLRLTDFAEQSVFRSDFEFRGRLNFCPVALILVCLALPCFALVALKKRWIGSLEEKT